MAAGRHGRSGRDGGGVAVRTLTKESIIVTVQTAFRHAIGHDQVADARLLDSR
jgi:hypothetical protein